MATPAGWPRSTSAASARCCADRPHAVVGGEGNVRPMNVPDGLLYSVDHEWARREGNRVCIGITDYAQDALGDVVYVQVPAVGAILAAGESFSEVESTKSVSDIYAPVAGTVVEVNDSLSDHPEQVNNEPYGAGWLCVIEVADVGELSTLLSAADYRTLLEG